MSVNLFFFKEAVDAGLYKQAVTMNLELLKSMCEHFVEMNTIATLIICTVLNIRCNGYTDAVQKYDILLNLTQSEEEARTLIE